MSQKKWNPKTLLKIVHTSSVQKLSPCCWMRGKEQVLLSELNHQQLRNAILCLQAHAAKVDDLDRLMGQDERMFTPEELDFIQDELYAVTNLMQDMTSIYSKMEKRLAINIPRSFTDSINDYAMDEAHVVIYDDVYQRPTYTNNIVNLAEYRAQYKERTTFVPGKRQYTKKILTPK